MSHKNTTWYVYIVRCKDKTLYTGVTTDLKRRCEEHNSSNKGAKYTRHRRPVKLVYSEISQNRSMACKREYQIKSYPLSKKIGLIQKNAPEAIR